VHKAVACIKAHATDRDTAERAVRQAGQGVTNGYSMKHNCPWVYNVEADPQELWNINAGSRATIPVAKALTQDEDSIAKYPNFKPDGEGPSQPDTDSDTTPSTIAVPQG